MVMAFDIGHVTLRLFIVYNLKVKIGMSDSDRERVVVYIFVTWPAEYLILPDVSAEYSTCLILFCASLSSFRAL
jgi:hypothetical protein